MCHFPVSDSVAVIFILLPFSSDLISDYLLEPEPPTDPLLQLISLQKASGSWEMHSSVAKVLQKTPDELDKLMPVGVKYYSLYKQAQVAMPVAVMPFS